MNSLDKKQVTKAIVWEVNTHTERDHWELIHKEQVQEGVKVLSAVWAMKQKEDNKFTAYTIRNLCPSCHLVYHNAAPITKPPEQLKDEAG
eukprot:3867015-Ditylum_brightwellii.AAC.1